MNNLYLKSFIRCKRKAWLDYQGNKLHKIWSPHLSIEIINRYKNFYKISNGDLYTGTKACKKGSRGVIGLKARSKLTNNINAEIQPQLLKKVVGHSKWGDYKYIPVMYKLGHRTTKEHLFDLAFCSILLEPFQESKIEAGLVISNYSNQINIERIDLNQRLRKKVLSTFLNLNETLKRSIPDITEDRKKCTICSWQKFCDTEAKDNGYLTDIDGIGSKTAFLLHKSGISNIKELATAREIDLGEKLNQFKDQKFEKASKFINQSKAYLSGTPIRIFESDNLSSLLSKKDSGFFMFDIESNPDEKHDFLYGFLKVNNLFENVKDDFYDPILNLKKNCKKSNQEIIQKLLSEKSWPVLHYGETEKIAILKLARQLNLDVKEIEILKSRFIDLHLIVRGSWILPIRNYSLKTVANWMGFKWRQKNVSGSKALYWWIQYKNTLNDLFLKKIIQYNRDDCMATLQIAKWLIKKRNY
ncbi:TM0106 family RecB-like putative nuclease [Prochlorococcus marinus]|uniref:TM0106 family RecB-like putative nuclease n=1 Tax=Prochlorococcus marinus TaxID=1219 RepID=UPI0005A22EFB|nr:TM0106 family RecB-like putative nuclease [Prochlorococcus marinus]